MSRRALSSTLRAMLNAELPGPLDFEALIPPVERAWVRRVSGCNLWVFYRFDANALRAVTLAASPPVPMVEDQWLGLRRVDRLPRCAFAVSSNSRSRGSILQPAQPLERASSATVSEQMRKDGLIPLMY
jgi:hypothetical protein